MRSQILGAFFLSGALLSAQPFLNYRGVGNAGSLLPPGHPGGSIARGSIFSLSGRNLGPADSVTASAYPLDNVLAGVSVEISQGTVSMPAIPIFAGNSLVRAVMPSGAPPGQVSVRVTFNGRRSNAALVNVVESSVGLFAVNNAGYGPGVVQNVVSPTEAPFNTTRVSAQPGQTLILSATGLGAVSHADNLIPTPEDLDVPLEIFVGGKLADRRYAGRSDCCAGLDQIIFDVPSDTPEGCYVPVQVRTRGAVVSNAVTIAVEREGQPCLDSFNPASEALRAGGRIGIAMPHRVDARVETFLDAPFNVVSDWTYVILQEVASSDVHFNPVISLPPLGTCTVSGSPAGLSITQWLRAFASPALPLDAGSPMAVRGPSATINVSRTDQPGIFSAFLGKTPNVAGAAPLFFSAPGDYHVSLPGGPQVGALTASFAVSRPLSWTNRTQISTLDRRQPLTLNWTGAGERDIVLIAGTSRDVPNNAAGVFICSASASDGGFTVPQHVLAGLPKTAPGSLASAAEIFVGAAAFREPGRFSGPGLDTGFIFPTTFSLKTVTVQ